MWACPQVFTYIYIYIYIFCPKSDPIFLKPIFRLFEELMMFLLWFYEKNKRAASTVAFICRLQKIHSSAMCHKTKDFLFSKNLLLGVDGGDGDDGRISSHLQPPRPIAPRDGISRSGKPLTPIRAGGRPHGKSNWHLLKNVRLNLTWSRGPAKK